MKQNAKRRSATGELPTGGCVHAKQLLSCPTLSVPMDCSPAGSSVHGIFQAQILEWVPIPFSRGSSQSIKIAHVSYVSCIGRWVFYHQHHLVSPDFQDNSLEILRWERIVYIKILLCCAQSVMSDSFQPYGLQPARLLCPWGFSRQEYWSVLPCHLPGDLPSPGIKLRSLALQVNSLPSETPRKPKRQLWYLIRFLILKVGCFVMDYKI